MNNNKLFTYNLQLHANTIDWNNKYNIYWRNNKIYLYHGNLIFMLRKLIYKLLIFSGSLVYFCGQFHTLDGGVELIEYYNYRTSSCIRIN